jgi:hypothetical protein
VGKEYINILTETIASGSGNSRKNFQLKLYENYTNSLTPPSPTAGRIKLFEYITVAPAGNIQTIQNPIVVYETQNGKVPLSGVTYLFHASYAPASGVVNSDGFMLADGATVPPGNALAGWITPNLMDGSYIEGATVPSVAGLGSNNKTLSTSEMPLHNHTMAGSGSSINVVTDIGVRGAGDNTGVPVGYFGLTPFNSGTNNYPNSPIQNNILQLKQNVAVSISGNTGNAGSGTAFDMRTKRKQGIPLIRVN